MGFGNNNVQRINFNAYFNNLVVQLDNDENNTQQNFNIARQRCFTEFV